MGKNTNGVDRIVRIVIAIAAVVGAAALGFGTVGAWILLVVAAIMVVTAAVGFCPLYRLFGISSNRARA
jgi:hypothetical protein